MIDRSSTRDSPTLATAVNAASLLGARVADTSSAAPIQAPKPHIWAQAIRITPTQSSCKQGAVHICEDPLATTVIARRSCDDAIPRPMRSSHEIASQALAMTRICSQ